jgi:hypothetical protein
VSTRVKKFVEITSKTVDGKLQLDDRVVDFNHHHAEEAGGTIDYAEGLEVELARRLCAKWTKQGLTEYKNRHYIYYPLIVTQHPEPLPVSKRKPFDLEAAKRGEKFQHVNDRLEPIRFIGVRQDGDIVYEQGHISTGITLRSIHPSHLRMVEEEPKPFDLLAAQRGAPISLCNALDNPVYYVGLDRDKRVVVQTDGGILLTVEKDSLRMAPKPKPKTHYLNVYRDADGTPEAGLYFYPSQEAADKNAREDRHRITTLSFTDTE